MDVIFSVVLLKTARYAARHSFMKLSNLAVDSRRTFSEKDTLDALDEILELEDLLTGLPNFTSDMF